MMALSAPTSCRPSQRDTRPAQAVAQGRRFPPSLSLALTPSSLLFFLATPSQSKNYNVFMGAVRASGKYSFRFSALVTSYSLLSTFFSQSFAKAKSWRDEDRLARCLVRNYDGLGNSRTPEEEKIREEELKKAAVGMLWPNEDGFEPWDWVGAVGSGAASGGILCAGMGFYRESHYVDTGSSRRARRSSPPFSRPASQATGIRRPSSFPRFSPCWEEAFKEPPTSTPLGNGRGSGS